MDKLTHLHTLGVLIGRCKTRTTLCGLKRPESALVTGSDEATCPACRAKRDEEINAQLTLISYAKERGTATADLLALGEKLRTMPKYRNHEFLR